MRIRFDCRHCGAGISASDWDGGRAILCSTCQHENIVPAQQAPALHSGDDRVPNLAIPRGSGRWLNRQSSLVWGVLAVAVLGVTFGGLSLLVGSTHGPNDLIPLAGNNGAPARTLPE